MMTEDCFALGGVLGHFTDAQKEILRLEIDLQKTTQKLIDSLQAQLEMAQELKTFRDNRTAVLEKMQVHMAAARRLWPGYNYDGGARQAILDYTESLCDVLGEIK